MVVKILAVGDVCGQPGLDALDKKLKPFQKENNIAFTVVNGENANVVGITPKQADMIFRACSPISTSAPASCARQTTRRSARAAASMSTTAISGMCAY